MRTSKLMFCLVLALAFCATAFAGDSPVDIQLIGPAEIHAGEALPMTATVTNRSAQPVAIAIPGADGIGYFNYVWKVTDAAGEAVPRRGEVAFPLESDLSDANFVILQPGEKYTYALADVLRNLTAMQPGTCTVTLTYRYHHDWSADYLSGHVSATVAKALAATPSMWVTSAHFSVAVQPYPAIAQHRSGQ